MFELERFLRDNLLVKKAQIQEWFKHTHDTAREYHYCKFHSGLENKNGVNNEQIHCSLDDCMFGAYIIYKSFKGEQCNEMDQKIVGAD